MLNQKFNPHIRAAQGAILSIGAPFGWLLIRLFQGAEPIAELNTNIGLYTYMLLGTSLAFSLFGWYVGGKERLVAILALRDALTGLYNVRYFRERLEQEVKTAIRENTSLVLILFDIDHFKMVNDNNGHPVGDEVLKAISLAANNMVRKDEVLARIGGEEFAILLSRCQLNNGIQTAERIRKKIAATVVHLKNERQVTVTVSLGITKLKSDDDDKQFLERADAALYEAKKVGRNRAIIG